MKKLQFYWHLHHDILLESLTEPLKNRIKYIKENKPKDEIELRLKLIKPVKGKLPQKLIEAERKYYEARQNLYEAEQKYYKVRQKYIEALRKLDEARRKYVEARWKFDEADQKYDEARQKYVEAWQKYNEARQKYEKLLKSPEILALHKKECPDCSWDGRTIFKGKEV